MAIQWTINPFTGVFEPYSQLTLAPVGSTPNANGASILGQVLTLQPSDSTNPGLLTAIAQNIAGVKTFSSDIWVGNNPFAINQNTIKLSTAAPGPSPGVIMYSGGSQSYALFQQADTGIWIDIMGTGQNVAQFNQDSFSFGNSSSVAYFTGNSTTVTAVGNLAAANLSGINTGDVTLTAVGSTPSANGASLSGQALTLQPADGTHPGLVTILTQTFAGQKTFSTGLTGTLTGSASLNLLIANNLSDVANKTTSFNNISPITTTGDLIYGSGTNASSRLPIGSTANVLTVSGGIPTWAPPATSGTVTSISVVSANGLAGTVATSTTTPAITLSTTVTGVLKGNSTAISAATAGTDYSSGTSALASGVVHSTTGTGVLSVSTVLVTEGGTGQVTANAGFNALSPMTTAGDLIYENATPAGARLAIGSTGNVLTVSGGLPVWSPPATSGTVTSVSVTSANGFAGTVATSTTTPAITISTSITGLLKGNGTAISAAASADLPTITLTGDVTGSASGGSIATTYAGTVPINKGGTGQTTASAAFNALSPITTTGDMIYSASGATNSRLPIGSTGQVLEVVSGIPAWTSFKAPTIQKFTSASGTYTTPTSPAPLYIRIVMVGGGGGGSASGTASGGAGGAGTASTFGTSLLSAGGGTGGSWGGGGASGGSASLGSGPIGISLGGATGSCSGVQTITGNSVGGNGGASAFGGAGQGLYTNINGGSGQTNTGGGGGGGGLVFGTAGDTGSGGGSGGYVDALITSSIAATYAYVVGAGGSAGVATTGNNGGTGGSGLVTVFEYYQ